MFDALAFPFARISARCAGCSATGNGVFTRHTVDELLELVDAVQHAQTQYRLIVSGAQATPMDRAQWVLAEVRATLEWAFDDGQVKGEDHQLETLAADHDGALSQDAVAAALFDYSKSLAVILPSPARPQGVRAVRATGSHSFAR